MSEDMNTTYQEYGKTVIANEVVAIIAGIATSEVPGVAAMSSGIVDDITTTLGMKSSKRGVKVEITENTVNISISIVVDYGIRIPDVAQNIRTKVIDAVQTMTGLTVSTVNIYVQGINVKKDAREAKAEHTVE